MCLRSLFLLEIQNELTKMTCQGVKGAVEKYKWYQIGCILRTLKPWVMGMRKVIILLYFCTCFTISIVKYPFKNERKTTKCAMNPIAFMVKCYGTYNEAPQAATTHPDFSHRHYSPSLYLCGPVALPRLLLRPGHAVPTPSLASTPTAA